MLEYGYQTKGCDAHCANAFRLLVLLILVIKLYKTHSSGQPLLEKRGGKK